MERTRSDLPAIVAALVATVVAGGIIYAAVNVAIVPANQDTNSPNGTTGGPPAAFQK